MNTKGRISTSHSRQFVKAAFIEPIQSRLLPRLKRPNQQRQIFLCERALVLKNGYTHNQRNVEKLRERRNEERNRK